MIRSEMQKDKKKNRAYVTIIVELNTVWISSVTDLLAQLWDIPIRGAMGESR